MCQGAFFIQKAHLNGRFVDISAHLAAERVDFAHQMAFRRAADRGIAGHHADIVHRDRDG